MKIQHLFYGAIAILIIAFLVVIYENSNNPKPVPTQNVNLVKKQTPVTQRQSYVVNKIIKAKKEHIKTDYGYRFDGLNTVLSGKIKIRHQPNISTVYYLIYKDGSNEEVSMQQFAISSVGDTISKTYWR